MSWERALLDLFDDLEARAEGMAQELRDDEVADLARAEYAGVSVADRLHGSVGDEATLDMAGGVRVGGRLERVGRGCAVLVPAAAPRTLHLVNLDHVLTVSTGSGRAAAEPLRGVTSRLGFGSAVRHLADEVDAVAVTLPDGRRVVGDLGRVGADFLELTPHADRRHTTLVPFRAVVVLVPA